ncbi:2Fe-2S iron-sulfur cluster-binding protein [Primorskyibacter flagellatus]|uniref:2Fe-2S iron-sulfur cluster-binding protein n=1 Tax=Primorskyibacter flagellatus TaxID=1387277 RepID=UPI00399F6146
MIKFVEADGKETEAEVSVGGTVMQAAIDVGVAGIIAECGGSCACGTCHCYIDAPWREKLTPARDNEVGMLEFVIDPATESRLSCQLTVDESMDGMIVRVPDTQT